MIVAAVKELVILLPVSLSALRFDAAGEDASSAQHDSAVSCTVPRPPVFSQQQGPPPSLQDMVHTAPETGAAAMRTTRTAARTSLNLFLVIS